MSTPRRSTRSTAGIGAAAVAVAGGPLQRAKIALATPSSSASIAVVPPPSKKRKTGTRQIEPHTASAQASQHGHDRGAVSDHAPVQQKQGQDQGRSQAHAADGEQVNGHGPLGGELPISGWTIGGEQEWPGSGADTGTGAQALLAGNQTISHQGLGEYGYNHGHRVNHARENGHHSGDDNGNGNGNGNAGAAGVSGDSLSLEQGQGQVQAQARDTPGGPLSNHKVCTWIRPRPDHLYSRPCSGSLFLSHTVTS